MMIAIKSDLPENCRDCAFEMFYMNCGETRCRATNQILAKDYKPIPFENRPDFCPLVIIPEHGRLIDADKLRKAFKKPTDWSDSDQVMYHVTGIWAEIDAAPTVIEGDKK